MYALFEEIGEFLNESPKCGSTHILTIDGRAGSGKTTFAAALAHYLARKNQVQILHLDDIYSGWESALGPKLTQTLESIRKSLSSGESIELPIFNWGTNSFDSIRKIAPCDILIIEGVGSGQKILRSAAKTSIWLDIDAQEGLARVLERDGKQIESHMSAWQKSEEEHFAQEKTREFAEFIIATE